MILSWTSHQPLADPGRCTEQCGTTVKCGSSGRKQRQDRTCCSLIACSSGYTSGTLNQQPPTSVFRAEYSGQEDRFAGEADVLDEETDDADKTRLDQQYWSTLERTSDIYAVFFETATDCVFANCE